MDPVSPEGFAGSPIKFRVAELPEGVAAIVVADVDPGEMLPGETIGEALIRLNRAVVIRA